MNKVSYAITTWASIFVSAFLLNSISHHAYAAEVHALTKQKIGAQTLATSPLNTGSVTHLLLVLILIVLAIMLLAFLARRVNGGLLSNNDSLKSLASVSVGARERIVVFKAGEKQLLLGVTANTISLLHEFDQAIIDEQAQVSNTDFKAQLAKVMGKGGQ